MYNIHLLPAEFGDAILIEYGDETIHYILIDGGPYYGFDGMLAALRKIAPALEELELLVVTHIDIDHIDGIVTLLNRDVLPFRIKEVWFNGYEQLQRLQKEAGLMGGLQGEYLSVLINRHKLPLNTHFAGGAVVVHDDDALPNIELPGGMKITLLNPGLKEAIKLGIDWETERRDIGDPASFTSRLENDHRYAREIATEGAEDLLGDSEIEDWQNQNIQGDKTTANGSSIAFIAAFKNKSCLFAGDATSECLKNRIDRLLIDKGLERLTIDAWKLAHHGSKKSTLETLMRKIDCRQILVSSNGKRYAHPDKPCIAKLLRENGPGLVFYFNYRSPFNEIWDNEVWQKQYQYRTVFPAASHPGVSVSLL